MSITTHTSTIRQWVKNHTKDDIAIYFEDQFVKKEAAIDAAKNLLAVIHRDGGHHTDKVGFIQSCKDAEQVRHELFSALEGKDAEIERLKAENAELRREIGGFQHLSDMRQCMIDTADENERLKKALEQAVKRADLRLPVPGDGSHCELTQRLPVWPHHGAELTAYLKEKEKQGCE